MLGSSRWRGARAWRCLVLAVLALPVCTAAGSCDPALQLQPVRSGEQDTIVLVPDNTAGCYVLATEGQDSWRLSGPLHLALVGAGGRHAVTVRLNNTFGQVALADGVDLELRNLVLQNTLLPPASSADVFEPQVFSMEQGSTLHVLGSVIHTACTILDDYLGALITASGNGSSVAGHDWSHVVEEAFGGQRAVSLHVGNFTRPGLSILDSWVTCNRHADPTTQPSVQAFVSDARGLDGAVTAAHRSSVPATSIVLLANVSLGPGAAAGSAARLPAPFSTELRGFPVVTAQYDGLGLAPRPSSLPWLDLGGITTFLSLGGVGGEMVRDDAMEIRSLGLAGSCAVLLLPTGNTRVIADRAGIPDARLALASLAGWATGDPTVPTRPRQLIIRDSVIAVGEDEVVTYQYWAALSASCARPFLLAAYDMLGALPMDALLPADAGETWVVVRNLTLPGLTLLNVTLTSSSGAVTSNAAAGNTTAALVDCATGDPVPQERRAQFPLRWVSDDAGLQAVLQNLTELSLVNPAAGEAGVVLVEYPRLVNIGASVRLPTPDVALLPRITQNLVLTGPSFARLAARAAAMDALLLSRDDGPGLVSDVTSTRWWWGSLTRVTLDLAGLQGAVNLAPGVQLLLQDLTLRNLVPVDLAGVVNESRAFTGAAGPTSSQRHSLPLFAFNVARNVGTAQIQLDSCTLELSSPDYAVLYWAAYKGNAWKMDSADNNLLIQRTEVFDVAHASPQLLVLSQYLGWGINATNLKILPLGPVNLTLELGGAQSPAPNSAHAPSPSSVHLNATALVGGVVGGVMVLLLLILVPLWVIRRRRDARAAMLSAPDSPPLRSMENGKDGLICVVLGPNGPMILGQGLSGTSHGSLPPPPTGMPGRAGSTLTSCGNSSQDNALMLRQSVEYRSESANLQMVCINGTAVPACWRELYEGLPSSANNAVSLLHLHPAGERGIDGSPWLPETLDVPGLGLGGGVSVGAGSTSRIRRQRTGCSSVRRGSSVVADSGPSAVTRQISGGGGLSSSGVVLVDVGTQAHCDLDQDRSPLPSPPPALGTLQPGIFLAVEPLEDDHSAGVGKAQPLARSQANSSRPGASPTPEMRPLSSSDAQGRVADADACGLPQAQDLRDSGSSSCVDAAVQVLSLHKGEAAQDDNKSPPVTPKQPLVSALDPSWDPKRAVSEFRELLGNTADTLTLLEPIGQGGFGMVYRGKWRGLEVAVKTVLFTDKSLGPGNPNVRHLPQQSALMEAAVCTSVQHPNVVATYHFDIIPMREHPGQAVGLSGSTIIDDAHAADYKLYLVQEFCNASLQDALRNQLLHDAVSKAPDLDLVLSLLQDVARGMEYIHAHNIIHGDLTPGNVLLKQDSDSGIGVCAKINDFGLSSALGPGQSHISNIANGTPFYVAPEVLKSGIQTKASDVYSFGVLMWELYRCMPPWVHTDAGYAPNPRFRRFPGNTPRVYIYVCARCLCQRPVDRPSFSDVLQELRCMHTAYLAGFPSLQTPGKPSAMVAAAQAAAASQPPGGLRVVDGVAVDPALLGALGAADEAGGTVPGQAGAAQQPEAGAMSTEHNSLVEPAPSEADDASLLPQPPLPAVAAATAARPEDAAALFVAPVQQLIASRGAAVVRSSSLKPQQRSSEALADGAAPRPVSRAVVSAALLASGRDGSFSRQRQLADLCQTSAPPTPPWSLMTPAPAGLSESEGSSSHQAQPPPDSRQRALQSLLPSNGTATATAAAAAGGSGSSEGPPQPGTSPLIVAVPSGLLACGHGATDSDEQLDQGGCGHATLT